MRELRFPPCAAVLASHLAPQPVGGLAKPCRRSESGKNSRRPHIAAILKMNDELKTFKMGDDAGVLETKLDQGKSRPLCAGNQPVSAEAAYKAACALAPWLSAALDDPKVCTECRAAINSWFDCAMPYPPLAQPEQEPVALPDGKRLILVDGTFDDLVYWLNRCDSKGHLERCGDLEEPWANFKYEDYTSPPERQPLTGDHPLTVFAKECAIGAYREQEIPDAARRALKASA